MEGDKRIRIQFETTEGLNAIYVTGIDVKEISVEEGVIYFGKKAAISLNSFVSYEVKEKEVEGV